MELFRGRNPSTLRIFESFATALVCFVLYLSYVRMPTFLDELDNIIGGQIVGRGGDVYSDFFSQHTPFAYWLSGAGYILGAQNLVAQRVFVYLIFSLCLGLLYWRYSRTFGRLALFAISVFFVTSFADNPALSYTYLSDHIQAVAYLFIILEILRVVVNVSPNWASFAVMSLSSYVAISSAFVSVYFVFVAVISYVVLIFLNRKLLNFEELKSRKLALWGLALIVAPWLVTMIYLAARGLIIPLYEQAYLLNVETYSKYIGGFGTSAVSPLVESVPSFVRYVIGLPNSASLMTWAFFRTVLNLSILTVFIVQIFKIRWTSALVMFFLVCFSAARGYSGFHSQPYWGYLAIASGIVLWGTSPLGISFRKVNLRNFKIAIAVVISGLLVLHFAKMTVGPNPAGSIFGGPSKSVKSQIIEALVPEGQKYWDTSLDTYEYVLTQRSPAFGMAGLVPWFAEKYEPYLVEQLKLNPPALIFHNPENEVWGKKVGEFAKQIDQTISLQYEKLDLSTIGFTEGVFVRKGEAANDLKKLSRIFPELNFSVVFSVPAQYLIPLSPLTENSKIIQTVSTSATISAIQISFGTYLKQLDCNVTVGLSTLKDEVTVDKPCSSVLDNRLTLFELPQSISSTDGRIQVTVQARDLSLDKPITIWTNSQTSNQGWNLQVNGVTQSGALVMQGLAK